MLEKLRAFFVDVIEVVVWAIAIFLFVYLLVLQPHKIKGSSMEPNFPDGEFLLTDKVTYRFREPARGEVVVFKSPTARGDEFIKRIIALPGETITLKNDSILINGRRLNEAYLSSLAATKGGPFIEEGVEKTVPPGNFFVLGDNRDASSDSRVWGFITKKDITGRAWIIYWPPPTAGPVPKVIYSFDTP